jgi:methylenetetrahydrofolate reductase (NADPH)
MNQPRLSRRPDIGARIHVSFEFFPPKTDEMEARLWDTVKRLEPLEPRFVSVTYGAGGSTRERTARTVRRILTGSTLMPAAHLTCVDATRGEIDKVIAEFAGMGVTRFVALRGRSTEGAWRFRHLRLGLSGKASRKSGLRHRHRHAEAQGRQRCDAGNHTVLLRQ